jgi:phage-related baseplate assembly protein
MSTTSAVDLSKLPAPEIVEPLDYETIRAARLARLREILDAANLLPDWDPTLEGDIIVKLVEEAAYRELLMRQRVNEGAKAVMLAFAVGSDLDHLAANLDTERLTVTPADPNAIPPTDAVMETNANLRARAQLAFEGLSTAGPEGAYLYHALSADPRVLDVAITSPEPGVVVVTILSTEPGGIASADLLDTVRAALAGVGDGVRPFTDHVTVQAATAIPYAFTARLDLRDGVSGEVAKPASASALAAFVAKQRRLGEPVTVDGLHAAARVEGVLRVTLQGFAEVAPAATAFADCTGFAVTTSDEAE